MTGPEATGSANGWTGETVLGYQVRILRHLNDELLRTVRLHLLIAGVLLTAVSIVGTGPFLLDDPTGITSYVWWGVVLSAAASAGIWLTGVLSVRGSYTDLHLESARTTSSLTREQFRNSPDESPTDSTCEQWDRLRRNTRLLHRRERVVNATQRYLNVSMAFVLFGAVVALLL